MESRVDELEPEANARNLGMLCHLLSFCVFVCPFGNIVGPLVLWLTKREEYEFVDDQGREVLNFQISWTVWALCALPLCFIIIGFPILFAILIGGLVLTIVGAVRAQGGEFYRYPCTVQWIR